MVLHSFINLNYKQLWVLVSITKVTISWHLNNFGKKTPFAFDQQIAYDLKIKSF